MAFPVREGNPEASTRVESEELGEVNAMPSNTTLRPRRISARGHIKTAEYVIFRPGT